MYVTTKSLFRTVKKNSLLFLSFLLIHAPGLHAQQEWKLKLNRDGIQIYSSAYGDSKIKALKVNCMLKATFSQLAGVLLDIKAQDEWFYHTNSTVLLSVSPTELYYYAELNFPFPFSNRDFIEHVKISQDPVTKTMTMDVENMPRYIPPKKDIVRVYQSTCKWVVTPAAGDQIKIEFTLFADPGGSIPVWLINLFSVYGPYETFKKLKTQIQKPAYLNARFAFITN